MPVRWTAELDAVLLHGVFEECSISFSKALCTKIAQRVTDAGMPCTAKAVEGRLYSWKKKNTSGNTNLNSATSTPAKSAPAIPIRTPRPRAKATPRAKKDLMKFDNGSEARVDDAETLLSPTAARSKRALNGKSKASYTEAESDGSDVKNEYLPKGKRVKQEPVGDDEVCIEPVVEDEV